MTGTEKPMDSGNSADTPTPADQQSPRGGETELSTSFLFNVNNVESWRNRNPKVLLQCAVECGSMVRNQSIKDLIDGSH